MPWDDMHEKIVLNAWAEKFGRAELTGQYFSVPNTEKETYWCEYSQMNDISEYGFKTVPELEEMLGQALTEEFYKELLLPLAVAAFKEKKIIQIEKGIVEDCEVRQMGADEFTIPEFVYQF